MPAGLTPAAKSACLTEVGRYLPPEFINRLDDLVPTPPSLLRNFLCLLDVP